MKVLLSIKPEFAEKIFSGIKQFEFRRTIFKNKDVKKVIVYASSPVQKVIGEFEIDEIINSDLESLWRRTQKFSGISKDFFLTYFIDRENGFAIKIKNAKRYKTEKCIRKDFNAVPPQSFLYID